MWKLFTITGLMMALLGGCTLIEARAGHAATAAIQRDVGKYSDAELTLAHPILMSRRGGVLQVRGQTFRDQGNCREGDCTRYRADGVWRGEYVGIQVNFYEDGDYYLAGDNFHEAIGSRPIPSPSGKRFFTGHHDDRDWSPYQGASVWEWEPHPRRLRIVDTNLVMFDRFVGWRGDRCIEFIGARGYNVKARPTQTFWLAEQHGDWQLLEEVPAVCAKVKS